MFDRSELASDPLSDLLRLAEVRTLLSGELRAGGAWAMRLPPPTGLKFFAVLQGQGWIRLGDSDPSALLRLGSGDVVLMRWDGPYLLASDLAAPPADARALFGAADRNHGVVTLGEGFDFHQLGGHVLLDAAFGPLLLSALPPLVHLRCGTTDAQSLRGLVDRLAIERVQQRPGHAIVTEQLAQQVLLQSLRIHLEQARDDMPAGWLRAMTDARLLPALRCLHGDPGRDWQLDELARVAAMSRTSFAFHFKAACGTTPLAYLTHWRMLLAQRELRRSTRPLAAWIGDLGYSSESAFSHAFKRIVGEAPAHYRQRHRAGELESTGNEAGLPRSSQRKLDIKAIVPRSDKMLNGLGEGVAAPQK